MRNLIREALGLAMLSALLVSSVAASALIWALRGAVFKRRLCEDLRRLEIRAEGLQVNVTVTYPGGSVRIAPGRGLECSDVGYEAWSLLSRLGWWIVGRGFRGG